MNSAPSPEIRTVPSPILRTASMRVESTWTARKDAADLAREMLRILHSSPRPGVGLAAQQVGRLLRLFVWNPSGLASDDRAIANPYIIEAFGVDRQLEGCLSVPGITKTKARARVVRLRGYDLFTKEQVEITAHGLEARIFQHEVDHLDGFLFIDKRTAKPSRKKVPV